MASLKVRRCSSLYEDGASTPLGLDCFDNQNGNVTGYVGGQVLHRRTTYSPLSHPTGSVRRRLGYNRGFSANWNPDRERQTNRQPC